MNLPFSIEKLKGWKKEYIIAGEYIYDNLNGIESDNINFYVFTLKGAEELLLFFKPETVNINRGILSFKFNNYNISLHCCPHLHSQKIIYSFKFDYQQAYFDGFSVILTEKCKWAWKDKTAKAINPFIYKSEIEAIKSRGFNFYGNIFIIQDIKTIPNTVLLTEAFTALKEMF